MSDPPLVADAPASSEPSDREGRRGQHLRRVRDVRARPHARRCLRSAYLLTGDQHLAEDLVQSALARTHRAWRRLGRTDNAEAYTRKTMYHLQVSWWRRPTVAESLSATPPEPRGAAHRTSRAGGPRMALPAALRRLTAGSAPCSCCGSSTTAPRPRRPSCSASPSARSRARPRRRWPGCGRSHRSSANMYFLGVVPDEPRATSSAPTWPIWPRTSRRSTCMTACCHLAPAAGAASRWRRGRRRLPRRGRRGWPSRPGPTGARAPILPPGDDDVADRPTSDRRRARPHRRCQTARVDRLRRPGPLCRGNGLLRPRPGRAATLPARHLGRQRKSRARRAR